MQWKRKEIKIKSIEYGGRAMCHISVGMCRAYNGVFIMNIIPFQPFLSLTSHSITTTDQQHNYDASNTVQSNEVSMHGDVIYINRMNNFSCTCDRRFICINSSSSISFLQDIDNDMNDNVIRIA